MGEKNVNLSRITDTEEKQTWQFFIRLKGNTRL